ncbi:unnamed protein product, partial [marine sediment metagenome]
YLMIVREFTTTYVKKTKHRKRCMVCSKLIQDGELTHMQLIKTEKFYPVKGIMRFNTWKFRHESCHWLVPVGGDGRGEGNDYVSSRRDE